MSAEVENYWTPYSSRIAATLKEVVEIGLPDGEDFFWIILHPQDLRGLPLTINPANKDLEANDRWEHREILSRCIPPTVELPDVFTESPEAVDSLRDSVAKFLTGIWKNYHIESQLRFLFSLSEDGWFFDLKTGTKISAWNIGEYFD